MPFLPRPLQCEAMRQMWHQDMPYMQATQLGRQPTALLLRFSQHKGIPKFSKYTQETERERTSRMDEVTHCTSRNPENQYGKDIPIQRVIHTDRRHHTNASARPENHRETHVRPSRMHESDLAILDGRARNILLQLMSNSTSSRMETVSLLTM